MIIPDPTAFPDGMKPVVDYIHKRGLLFGIYTDRGNHTCVGRPGSQGYETLDANTYASWGVDYVKEDSCDATSDHNASFAQYGLMRDALNATGRHIYFDLCGWSSWYAPVGKTLGNAWRVGYDVNNWGGVLNNALAVDKNLAQYAGPGGWNDIDALIGTNPETAVHLTQAQSRTQFNLWALLSAQLIIGGSILKLNDYDLATYSNRQLIAINQDPAGSQAKLVMQFSQKSSNPNDPSLQQVWLKALANGDYAIAFVNTTNSSGSTVPLPSSVSSEDGAGDIALAPCNASDPAQLWNVSVPSADGDLIRIGSTVRTDGSRQIPAHCLEVNGCNYAPGAHVDTSFGCKALPKSGNSDKCAANMAWKVVTSTDSGDRVSTGALQSAWDPTMCLEIVGGGSLAHCDGSHGQQWTFKPAQVLATTDYGHTGLQQLVSGTGFGCLSNGPPASGAPTTLTFDVNSLGWQEATATDLWSGKVTIVSTLSVNLPSGDGISQVFRLAKKS